MAYLTNLDRTARTRPASFDWLTLEPLDLVRAIAPQVSGVTQGFEIGRTENGYTVEMNVAGFAPEQLEITLKDDVLTIAGKNDRREFRRTLNVPEDIDADHVEARVQHGLLTLVLNRRPEAEPKKIAISVN